MMQLNRDGKGDPDVIRLRVVLRQNTPSEIKAWHQHLLDSNVEVVLSSKHSFEVSGTKQKLQDALDIEIFGHGKALKVRDRLNHDSFCAGDRPVVYMPTQPTFF